MAEVIHECEFRATDSDGVEYGAVVMGEQRGNVWVGWLEFTPAVGDTLRTGEETSQPDRGALIYWASGLEPIYLEGALRRAG
jgi:hypothetical protein